MKHPIAVKRRIAALTSPTLASLVLAVRPASAAEGPFFSLRNTEFIVVVSFLLFVGVLLYFRVPQRLTGMLDARAVQIRADLDEARALRDEAKALLASYETRQKDVQDQAARIVAGARDEALAAAAQAKDDLRLTIARRLAGATDRIASAQAAAVREVRERAVNVAVAAAGDVLTRQATPDSASASIDAALVQVAARLH